jgi:hypothetical protein
MSEQPQSDHDLLIRVDEKLDGLSSEVKGLKDNLVKRVEFLERSKFDEAKHDVFCRDTGDKFKEVDKRLDVLENWRSGIIAVSTLMGGLLTWFAIRLMEHLSSK